MMFTGKVLALDLATVTGWCYGAPGERPEFGFLRFGPPGSSRAAIYREYRSWLNDWLIDRDPPKVVVFESAAIPMVMQGKTNANTIKLLIGMCEHTEELCFSRVELREAMASQVRAHFIGTNRVQRADAKKRTIERCNALGIEVKNDNEADAVALWHYQIAHLRPDLAYKTTPLFQNHSA